MRKYKATGCARFFVVMLILAPLAYVGAALYNGQDPVENVKELLNIGTAGSADDIAQPSETANDSAPASTGNSSDNDALNDALEEVKDLKKENADLQKRVEELEAELEAVKDTSGGE